jgi:hypothetical protein
LILKALDNDEFVHVASLDLPSAFDIVSIGLLLKRMRIIRLPEDVIPLVEVWPNERSFMLA